jgi:hypothetical protein
MRLGKRKKLYKNRNMDYIGEKELNNKLDDFKNHLKHADRMILSAKFGDGKSFFLQKIRDDKERFAEYEFITIYPVNYVVAQNDDIFEYIKRDILIQLMKLNLIEKIDLEKLLTSVFSFDSFKEVLFFLISSIPQYGPIIKKLLDKAISISEKYNDEKNTYEKYFDSFTVQRGGLYEDDAYTQMIKEAINLLKVGYINEKGEMTQKKPVLIIEDLDRLDPAHLFRILNVISAHIDDVIKPDKIGNKFGFSNIVIVMDYDTTKHIFEHFYGKNASYEGYMSKFLAEEPFKYSIIELAIAKLKTKLSEEIGIDILFINSLSILNLKIASFSMRDIVRIYDFDVHHRIKQNQYEVSDKLCLSTSLPIFKLILYMIEFGMSIGDIQEDLSYHVGYNVKEYLKLVFPLYAMEKKKKNKVFNLETDLIQARLEFSQNLATSVSVGYPEFQTGNSPSFSKEMRLSIINDIFCMNRHIDIASLNVNVGFTIPNYKSLI